MTNIHLLCPPCWLNVSDWTREEDNSGQELENDWLMGVNSPSHSPQLSPNSNQIMVAGFGEVPPTYQRIRTSSDSLSE